MCYALQGNTFQDATTKEDLKLGFKYGFKSVIEYRKKLGADSNLPNDADAGK